MPGAERREPHPAPAAGDGHNTADDDARSTSTVASTIATTASLSSRIAALAADFDDKLHAHIAPGIAEVEERGNEVTEEVIEITEEELLTILDAQEDPLELCSRLFFPHSSNPVPLQRLEMSQVEDLRQHGYVVIDGFLPQPEVVSGAFQETLRLVACKRLTLAAELPAPPAPSQSQAAADKQPPADVYTDRSARGDHILFLHPGQAPACTPVFAPLMLALQELQNDLSELMHLRRQTGEFQLAFYPGDGAAYTKHRDALPDDGSEELQRRVTAILYLNPEWQRSHGGELRLWPPAGRRTHEQGCQGPCRDGAAAAAAAAAAASAAARRRRSGGGGEDGGPDDSSDAGSQASSSMLRLQAGTLSTSSSVAVEPSTNCGSQQDADSSADGSVSERPTGLERGAGLEWGDDDGNMVLDVAPLGGRLVLFLSGAVDHAVRPCRSSRVAVTAWLQ